MNKKEFLSSWLGQYYCRMLLMDGNEILAEEGRLELYKNSTCYFEQISHKTPVVKLLTSLYIKYSIKRMLYTTRKHMQMQTHNTNTGRLCRFRYERFINFFTSVHGDMR